MPDTVNNEVVAGLKASGSKDVSAERLWIVLDTLLTKVLQRLAVVGIAA